jgi:hypothetical protein
MTLPPNTNSVRLYVTTTVASVGDVEFYVTHSPQESASHFDLCGAGDAPEIWGPLAFTGAATKSLVLQGLDLLPNEVLTVYFRASAGATTALIGIEALAFESFGSNVDIATGDIEIGSAGLALESGGNLDTIAGDTTALVSGLLKTEDAAHVPDKVVPLGVVRQDALAPLVDDGDIGPLQVNVNGSLQVYDHLNFAPTNGTSLSTAAIAGAVYSDDADWADGTSAHMVTGGLYQSTPQTITDGDVGPFQVDSNGNQVTREIAPAFDEVVNTSEADTTNVAAATHYYPDSDGTTLNGYKDLSLTGKLIDADGTLTMTVEMTNDEDTSGGDWIQVYGYDDKNKSTENSWAVTNGTLTFAISFNNANFRFYRIKVVASGATNTVIIKSKAKAL